MVVVIIDIGGVLVLVFGAPGGGFGGPGGGFSGNRSSGKPLLLSLLRKPPPGPPKPPPGPSKPTLGPLLCRLLLLPLYSVFWSTVGFGGF